MEIKHTIKNNRLIYIIIFLIVAVIGSYFRLYPLREFKSNIAQEKATLYVLSQLRTQAKKRANLISPKASKEHNAKITKKIFDKILHDEQDNVRQSIASLAHNLNKTIHPKDKSGQSYLLASDSFYFYKLTKNIKETGSISDTIKNSKYLNELMLAPDGHWEPLTLHPYIGYSIYKFIQFFNNNVDMMFAISFTPILISLLSLILFLSICKNLGFNPLISLTGSIFFILAPIFIRRSTFGWYDNDPYNTFFPLLILLSLLKCVDHIIVQAKENRLNLPKLSLHSLIIIFSLVLYTLFWQGWMLSFVIVAGSLVAIFIYNILFLKNLEIKNMSLICFAFFIIGSFLGISLLFGTTQFVTLFQEGWIALKNFLSPQLSQWPDLYISVGELAKSSLSEIMTLSGGYFLGYCALLGTFFCILNIIFSSKNTYLKLWPELHPFKSIIILISLSASIIITLGAQRFALLSLAPLCFTFMIACQGIVHFLKKKLEKNTSANTKHTHIIIVSVLIGILSSTILPIHHIYYHINKYLNPIFNQTWENALTYINDNTPKDSIINTWWSPGHFIKAIANRRIIFDGASINTPQAYWMANIYLSPTENEALGLLRMINNSANKASDYLTKTLKLPLSTSVFVLKEITKVNELQARVLLSHVLSNQDHINNIIQLTHGTPSSTYLLIYNEFVEKNLQLSFIANWNFKQIERINENPQLMDKVPSRNSNAYIQFLWDLSGGQLKYSGKIAEIMQTDKHIIFDENIKVNKKTLFCSIASKKYGKGIPRSIFYQKNGKVLEKKLVGSNLNYSILLYEEDKKYGVVLLDETLAKSLLINLYFFNGAGLHYIQPFYETSDLTKRTEIQIFKVDWELYKKDFLTHIKKLNKGLINP